MKRFFILIVCAFVSACTFRPFVRPPGDPDRGVVVQWWGHSCFSFKDSADRVFIIDPFDDTVGYPAPKLKPDAVLVTHEHFDHDVLPKPPMEQKANVPEPSAKNSNQSSPSSSNRSAPLPAFPVVRSVGTSTAAGIEVTGILADHDDEGGRRNGTTRLYVWEMGGLRFAHMGDIGQAGLRPDQREFLSNVDVLFIPVGGKTTVDGAQAAAMVQEISPRVVIPMHYGTPRTRFYEFNSVDGFLSHFKQVTLMPLGGFQLVRSTLPLDTTVYVPAPPAGAEAVATP